MDLQTGEPSARVYGIASCLRNLHEHYSGGRFKTPRPLPHRLLRVGCSDRPSKNGLQRLGSVVVGRQKSYNFPINKFVSRRGRSYSSTRGGAFPWEGSS